MGFQDHSTDGRRARFDARVTDAKRKTADGLTQDGIRPAGSLADEPGLAMKWITELRERLDVVTLEAEKMRGKRAEQVRRPRDTSSV
jgi:hypothetical protein